MAKSPRKKATEEEPAAPLYRKPRADVFTMLLVLALLAIILAIVALWQVMQEYGYNIKGGPSVSWLRAEGPAIRQAQGIALGMRENPLSPVGPTGQSLGLSATRRATAPCSPARAGRERLVERRQRSRRPGSRRLPAA